MTTFRWCNHVTNNQESYILHFQDFRQIIYQFLDYQTWQSTLKSKPAMSFQFVVCTSQSPNRIVKLVKFWPHFINIPLILSHEAQIASICLHLFQTGYFDVLFLGFLKQCALRSATTGQNKSVRWNKLLCKKISKGSPKLLLITVWKH